MRIIFFILIIFISTHALAFEKETIIQMDVTYDGEPEKLVYKVWAKSWEGPINWSFHIFDGNQLIYQHVENNYADDDFLEMYGDKECKGLADCQEKWFEKELFPKMIDEIKVNDNRYNEMLSLFLKNAPKHYQEQFAVTEEIAHQYVKRLHDFIKGKNIVGFSISESPVYFKPLLIYDKFLNAFVQFYAP